MFTLAILPITFLTSKGEMPVPGLLYSRSDNIFLNFFN